MPWLVVDLALVLIGLVVLLMVALSVWRAVKGLGREVTAAGAAIGAATDELARRQAEAGPRPDAVADPQPLPVTTRTPARRR